MKMIFKAVTAMVLLSTLITACTQNTQLTPTESFETQVAKTVAVMQTQQAFVSTITPFVPPTETPIPPTLTPTLTALAPSLTPTWVTPTPSQSYCISTFSNVNVPNNTVMKGGTDFIKTWTLTNGGSAAWGADFKVIFVSGESMSASVVPLDQVVLPGSSVDVSVDLIAPINEGDHQGNFMIQTDHGEKFGVGSNCDRPFWVLIRTKGLFTVTAAKVNASPASYTGACPATINLSTSITANGVGTVTYLFVTSTGKSQTYQLEFGSATTITSNEIPWVVKDSMNLEVHIYVDDPNHQDFKTYTIPITCTP
jgi:hypothetical protein